MGSEMCIRDSVEGPDVEVKKLTVFAEGYRYDSAQSPTSSAFAAARLRR